MVSQKWVHNLAKWNGFAERQQEQFFGRTKKESIELSPLPKGSHVERNEQDKLGFIVRQSQPFGDTKESGLRFLAFTNNLDIIDEMLKRMAGSDGVRDSILGNLSVNTAGAYWFVPNLQMLRDYSNPNTSK